MQEQFNRLSHTPLGVLVLSALAAAIVYVGYQWSAVTGSRPPDFSVSISERMGARWCQLTDVNMKSSRTGQMLDVYSCWRDGAKACVTVDGPVPVAVVDMLFASRSLAKRPACAK